MLGKWWSDIVNRFQSRLRNLAMRALIVITIGAAAAAFISSSMEISKIPGQWEGDAFNAAFLAGVTATLGCVAFWLSKRR
jgi:sugar/nucleoside kinase (ribokinase family)